MRWYLNSWDWRYLRSASSCWSFRRRDGLPGARATPESARFADQPRDLMRTAISSVALDAS
jgi:hypothetical protein